MWRSVLGLTLGLAAAFGGAHLLTSLLPEIEPTDPMTFVIVPLVFLAVAFIAAWLPAVRAARVDPMVTFTL
jgi:putative ABC transport system permease protein